MRGGSVQRMGPSAVELASAPAASTDSPPQETASSSSATTSLRPVWWQHPVCWYAGMLAAVVVVSWQVVTHVPGVGPAGPHMSFTGGSHLRGLARWDGGWYHHIANHGYGQHTDGKQSPVAFFPGYPLAMRFGGRLIGSDILAGIALTAASGTGSAVLFWHWCRGRVSSWPALTVTATSFATTATLVLLLYPFSYYLYGVVYADALFLFSALAAFTALERDRPLLAGLFGAVATLTRPVGIAVVVGLAVRALEKRGVFERPRCRGGHTARLPTRLNLGRVRLRDASVLVSVSGLAGYSWHLWTRFGDPFLFSSVQRYWLQPRSPATWLKVRFAGHLLTDTDSPYTWGLVVHALLALGALLLVPLVLRRFGLGYGVYCLIVLAVPIVGSKDFHGLGRYVLAAFPVFALAGHYLAEHPRIRRPAFATSGTILLLLMGGFAHGFYLA